MWGGILPMSFERELKTIVVRNPIYSTWFMKLCKLTCTYALCNRYLERCDYDIFKLVNFARIMRWSLTELIINAEEYKLLMILRKAHAHNLLLWRSQLTKIISMASFVEFACWLFFVEFLLAAISTKTEFGELIVHWICKFCIARIGHWNLSNGNLNSTILILSCITLWNQIKHFNSFSLSLLLKYILNFSLLETRTNIVHSRISIRFVLRAKSSSSQAPSMDEWKKDVVCSWSWAGQTSRILNTSDVQQMFSISWITNVLGERSASLVSTINSWNRGAPVIMNWRSIWKRVTLVWPVNNNPHHFVCLLNPIYLFIHWWHAFKK